MKKHFEWIFWMALGVFNLWTANRLGWTPLGTAAFIVTWVCFANAALSRLVGRP